MNTPTTLNRHSNNSNALMTKRRAGVLMHPTSLPGDAPLGQIGFEARRFLALLRDGGLSAWQMLPVGPTHQDASPYNSSSAFAGHPGMIDLFDFAQRHLGDAIAEDLIAQPAGLSQLHIVQSCLASVPALQAQRRQFEAQSPWLDDYALYCVIKRTQAEKAWYDWPTALKWRERHALDLIRTQQSDLLELLKLEQFLFFRQWQDLRTHAQECGIELIGDMPIYIAHDSADVWCAPELFRLDDDGMPTLVAGVPPDYFSKDGQRWGNPLYRWDVMEKDGYAWWRARFAHALNLFDTLRIDHFRGFVAGWEIPASEKTAVLGQWRDGPGLAFFHSLFGQEQTPPLIAEDLGIITDEVVQLRDALGLPGMKILQFAFCGDARNPYLPHWHTPNSVVYIGTHDNDTALGWFQSLSSAEQRHFLEYQGNPSEAMPRPLIRMALASVASLAILPMQDLLELDSNHRMNLPGTTENNWQWRFHWQQVPNDLTRRIREWNRLYAR
jgi:4-alpha-glucanotransferase